MAAKTSHSQFRSLGFYAIAWIEHFLVHGPGDVQGEKIELDDEFAAFILKAYAVSATGSRKVRRAFLSRAKGRSKSGLAAMIECFEALGECRFDHWAKPGEVSDWGYEFEPGEPVGQQLTYVECLNVATEESQAGNTYDAVYYMLHRDTCSLELLDRFGVLDVGLTRVNLPDSRGTIEPVTAANESKDGGKSTFIVADETHLWIPPETGKFKLGKMHQTMVRNLLKRKLASGWMLETSTMYAEGESSVAQGTHDYAKQVAASGRDKGQLLFDHRQASDQWDLTNRAQRIKALKEAYGPAAAWMDLQAIADYWDDPQASHAEFCRFFLNQPVPLKGPGRIDLRRWASPPLLDHYAEPPTRAALVVAVLPDRSDACIGIAGDYDGRTVVLAHSLPVSQAAAKVAELQEMNDIAEVALAGAPPKSLRPQLVTLGVEFEQLTDSEMGAACGAFLEAINEGTVVHVGQPELDRDVAKADTKMVGGKSEQWTPDCGAALVACSGAFYRWGLLDPNYEILESIL